MAKRGVGRLAIVVAFSLLVVMTSYLITVFLASASSDLLAKVVAPTMVYEAMTPGEYGQLLILIPILLVVCWAVGWSSFKKRLGRNLPTALLGLVLIFLIIDLADKALLAGSGIIVSWAGGVPVAPTAFDIILDLMLVLIFGLLVYLVGRGSGLARALTSL